MGIGLTEVSQETQLVLPYGLAKFWGAGHKRLDPELLRNASRDF